jgi:4-diphosphocytidyl-2-C-methyl-D-erythritol kinase
MANQLINTAPRWTSPAKLNLFLHINGRRADGYHELQTLFQFIDFADTLSFTLTDNAKITLTPSIAGVADEDNLIVRAARLLQSATAQKLPGVHIQLDKKLPMGGGIGGGSSNAATTLLVLNELWQLNLSLDALAEIGLSLGADVPVFVKGHAAFAEGVGERLSVVYPAEPWYLVLTPPVQVATAAIFNDPQLPRNTPKQSWNCLEKAQWHNDCQAIVEKHHPEVAQALRWLIEYAPSRMTGTGSCVFAVFETQAQAEFAMRQCPPQFSAIICRGHNRSPLHRQLAEYRNAKAEQ